MGPAFTRKYNTLLVTGTTAIRIPIIKRGVVDFAVGADWTPAAGDVKIAVDGAAAANVTNLPTAVAMGNTAYWEFILTAAELSCKSCVVTVADSATKAVEDTAFIVETFGNASAMYQADLSAANLPANVAQWSGTNVAAPDTAGYPKVTHKVGTGAGEINITSGVVDANATKMSGTSLTARDIGASVLLSAGTGTGQLDFTSGVVKANLAQILGTALTETAGQIAAAFKQFFDVASPTGTMKAITNVVTATNLTNAPTSGDFTSTMKTSLNNATPALSSAGVQAIWDKATSALTTSGSIGKWILDKLDVVLSTRLDTASYTAPDNTTIGTINTKIGTPASSVSADIAAVKTDTGNLINRLGAWTGSGVNTVLGAFKALLSKTASAPSDIGGTFDPATDSVEALRDRGDAAWVTGTTPDNTSITAIKAVTDKLNTAMEQDSTVYRFTANALEQAPSGGGGGGGDPWATDLPADYTSGQAGNVLGNLLANLSAAGVTVQSPVIGAGYIALQQGDDYTNADGRALSFTFTNVPSLTGATVSLKVGTLSVTGTVTASDAVRFDLTASQTRGLSPGRLPFEIEAVLATSGHVISLQRGLIAVTKDVG